MSEDVGGFFLIFAFGLFVGACSAVMYAEWRAEENASIHDLGKSVWVAGHAGEFKCVKEVK